MVHEVHLAEVSLINILGERFEVIENIIGSEKMGKEHGKEWK